MRGEGGRGWLSASSPSPGERGGGARAARGARADVGKHTMSISHRGESAAPAERAGSAACTFSATNAK